MIRLFEPGFFNKIANKDSDQTKSYEEVSASDQTTLAETVAWCNSQALTATPEESSDIRRRRTMVTEAGELYAKGRRCGERYPDGPHFRRGSALFTQADMSSLRMLHSQLRSPDMLPSSLSENLSTENFAGAFSAVVANRREHLKTTDIKIRRPQANAGSLLYYWPHENLACGAAEYSSNGFFDQNNVPPWDTWVSFDGLTLISWVPAVLIPLVQAGIDANPEGCISWTR